jgi:hypothetical protein
MCIAIDSGYRAALLPVCSAFDGDTGKDDPLPHLPDALKTTGIGEYFYVVTDVKS